MDMDFYHNRGKDSNLDLRSLENLEKIDFSEESEEEVIKKPKKKKKKSKKKKNKEDNKEIIFSKFFFDSLYPTIK